MCGRGTCVVGLSMLITLGGTIELIPPTWSRGLKHHPPWVFIVLQYFGKILPLVDSLWCALEDKAIITGCSDAGAIVAATLE